MLHMCTKSAVVRKGFHCRLHTGTVGDLCGGAEVIV